MLNCWYPLLSVTVTSDTIKCVSWHACIFIMPMRSAGTARLALRVHLHITWHYEYTCTSPGTTNTPAHHLVLRVHLHITWHYEYTCTSLGVTSTPAHHLALRVHLHITWHYEYTCTSPGITSTPAHHLVLRVHLHITWPTYWCQSSR